MTTLRRVALTLVFILGSAAVARADQCQLVTQKQATTAASVLKKGTVVFSWCEPCGEKQPRRQEVVQSVSLQPGDGDQWTVSVNGEERDLAYLFVQTGKTRVDNVAALAGCPTTDVTPFIDAGDTTGRGGKYVLDAKFAELSLNLDALRKTEEALRQSDREIEPGAPVGLYWGFPRPVPSGGKLGAAKLPWSDADRAIAAKIDWLVSGDTFGRYHVVVAGGDGALGPAMSMCAESDLDADGLVAAVVVFVPGRLPGGGVAPPPPAPCRNNPTLAPGQSLTFDPNRHKANAVLRLSPEGVY